MSKPTTAAGRLLLDKNTSRDRATTEWLLNDILAIEAEARQQDGSGLREALSLARSMILAGEPMSERAAVAFEEAFALTLPSGPPASRLMAGHDHVSGVMDTSGQCPGCFADLTHRPPSAPPALDYCDHIVNNGEGEPTECGRKWPCEYHTVDR